MEEVINNRFVVHKKLGEGGFGTVHLAYDRAIQEICALKLIRPELSANRKIHDKFFHEAKTWMEIGKHPNIVNVRAVDYFNGSLFVALEYIPPNELGVNTLDGHIRLFNSSLRRALKYVLDICEGMIQAYSRGLIAHRDLKPSNLMLDANETIKITDFGLAIFSVDPGNRLVDTTPSGTPVYMPPEQFVSGSTTDQRSDIYSFGMVLYELLSGGHLPFKIPSTDQEDYFTHFHRLHCTYRMPRFEAPVYPIIEKCLAKHPHERYESFSVLSKEIKRIYRQVSGEDYAALSTEEMDAAEHTNYATSYMILGDNRRALKHIDAAISLAPWYMQAYNNKAAILAGLGHLDDATIIWKELAAKAPRLARPLYNLGNLSMHAGDLDNAIRLFKMAVEREPEYIPAIVNLGICYQNRGRYDAAMLLYDNALEISPDDSKILHNKGYCLFLGERYPQAEEIFRKVIGLNPRHVSAHNYLGLCYQRAGRFQDAMNCYDTALSIDPTYRCARENMDLITAAMKKKNGLWGRIFGG